MPAYQWRTSTYSGDASNCVNLAQAPDGTIRLRDSKVPGPPSPPAPRPAPLHSRRGLRGLRTNRDGPSLKHPPATEQT
ncbi:DUF397 domain-containing protein [Streptomyces sp. M10(2022)]